MYIYNYNVHVYSSVLRFFRSFHPTSKRIFKLHVKAPLGNHLSISSNMNFVLANEDSAYNKMHRVSYMYHVIYIKVTSTDTRDNLFPF